MVKWTTPNKKIVLVQCKTIFLGEESPTYNIVTITLNPCERKLRGGP